MTTPYASIDSAIKDIAKGKLVILIDDESRENEGDLIVAAEHATADKINFMCKNARGLVCLSLMPEIFQRLNIPMMTNNNQTPHQTAFGVAFEAKNNITTGISAADRAESVKVAIDENSQPEDIIMPGHMFPLKACEDGVLVRAGHTEGSVDLAKLAGCKPAAVICEVMNDDGSMARLPDLIEFAKKHELKLIRLKDLIQYRLAREVIIKEVANAKLPTSHSEQFQIKVFRCPGDEQEHVALISTTKNENQPPLVRLHSECLNGDVFGSTRCDCGEQLSLAQHKIAQEGGVLIYMRQEGRGIGLTNKIKAYALQQEGLDTVEANHHLGFAADLREYAIAAQILKSLNINKARLLTNNPQKMQALQQYGIEVEQRVALETQPNKNNIQYLTTKRDKLGHLLDIPTKKVKLHE